MKRLDIFEADCFRRSVVLRSDQETGGANRDRTDDLMLAKHALSQLSYGPGYEHVTSPLACRAVAAKRRRLVGPGRVERPPSRLSGVRSNHLSYEPDEVFVHSNARGSAARFRRKGRETKGAARTAVCLRDAGNVLVRDQANPIVSMASILRKEVIQPQVPLRLPCYDFGPVADPTLAGCLLAVSAPS